MQWISENRQWDLASIEEASLMFDLTPLEEQFMIDQFVRHKGIGADEEE